MTTLADEMLRQYRATTTPQFRAHVDAFNDMSVDDRAELLFYMLSYVGQQYMALLVAIHGGPVLPPHDSPRGTGHGSPHGRAN